MSSVQQQQQKKNHKVFKNKVWFCERNNMTFDRKGHWEVSMLWYLTKTLKQLFKCAKKKDKELKKTENSVLTKPGISLKRV